MKTSEYYNYIKILFLAALSYWLGAIFAGLMILASYYPTTSTAASISPANNTTSIAYLIYLILSILTIAVLFKYRKEFLQKLFSRGLLVASAYYVFGSALIILLYSGLAFGAPPLTWEILSLVCGIALSLIWYKTSGAHNFYAVMISIATIGAIASAFTPFWLLIIFFVMSVWDLIAVFKLKFMQNLAGMAINGNGKRMYPLFISSGSQSALHSKLSGDPIQNEPKPALLGLGDLVIPGGFMASAVYFWHVSVFVGLPMLLLGLLADMWIATKYNKAIPALPILFIASVIAVII